MYGCAKTLLSAHVRTSSVITQSAPRCGEQMLRPVSLANAKRSTRLNVLLLCNSDSLMRLAELVVRLCTHRDRRARRTVTQMGVSIGKCYDVRLQRLACTQHQDLLAQARPNKSKTTDQHGIGNSMALASACATREGHTKKDTTLRT